MFVFIISILNILAEIAKKAQEVFKKADVEASKKDNAAKQAASVAFSKANPEAAAEKKAALAKLEADNLYRLAAEAQAKAAKSAKVASDLYLKEALKKQNVKK